MKVFEYKFNKSYSTLVISSSLIAAFVFLFQFINLRENTFILTLSIFLIVFAASVYAAFFHTKKIPLLKFKEDRLVIPAKLSKTDKDDEVMYRDFRDVRVFTGDIRNMERPGYTGIELVFERVENLQEKVFFEKKYLEEHEYLELMGILNSILQAR